MTPATSANVSYLTDTGPGSGRRTPARSWLRTDAPVQSLNGDWRFRLLSGAPGAPGAGGVLPDGEAVEDVARENFDDANWDTLPVPSHWVLQQDGRYGLPIYTNVQFPFPADPPNVPDANPTGDYRRTFDLPESWSDAAAIVLRFDGVESRYKVWINGIEIGVGVGSRLAQEFDVTDAVRPGSNVVVVRVHQWSASSYLEDQDQWWLPGIFRDVTLQARPVGGIHDVWVRAGFSGDATDRGVGRLETEVTAGPDAYPVTLSVPALGVDVTWESASDVASVLIDDVEPWSAEKPVLYDATISNAAETISLRLGFRTVEITDGLFLVNGRRVVFHGMNRHETHPDRGRVFDEDFAMDDLILMKQFNVNAIRTSHYPPHPRLLDLADELGFWVVLECDLETHGFVAHDWADNPSDDPRWRDAYVDRMERTIERDKNHPSIVMWSLGNEAGTGSNLAAMSAWAHARDSSRPVHYEGDYTGAYTDVYSRMYSSVPETDAIGRNDSRSLLLGCSAAESARQRTKPFLLCEYVHAMGNGPGAIDQYEDLVDRYPRLHGGFVWEWRDHGIRTTTADGTEYFGYGGDFGEVVHDGNFVMDGMVLSDSTPSPGLFEYKQIVSPIRLALHRDDTGTPVVAITNRRHSADASDLVFRWRVEEDGEVVASGEFEVDGESLVPGATHTVDLPVTPDGLGSTSGGAETWLTVEAQLATDAAWASAGHSLVAAQLSLGAPDRVKTPRRPGTPTEYQPISSTLTLGAAVFEHGRLASLAGQRVDGPRVELWRAPTDNDRGSGRGAYDLDDPWLNNGDGTPAPSSAVVWEAAGLDRLDGRVEEISQGEGTLTIRSRYAAADARLAVLLVEHWQFDGEDLWLGVDLVPLGEWGIVWPRLGVRFDLPGGVDSADWFGLGPRESYPDSLRSAVVGRHRSDIDDLVTPYARPQESGHRSDLRNLGLTVDGGPWLRIETVPDSQGRRPGFSLARHTAQQVARSAHPHELPVNDRTFLYLDAAQHGLGSRACGPDVWPDFILRPEARSLQFRIRADSGS
ncbi:beta-galactosidase [Mycetocola sp. CAN_C7]|uniref:glycoside hydrolase family 2 TIM barrel-domain containing protein n=1 Tax=Mycetocola sp. CAN_C7 TaxID=2787724 RepID=UPI0018CBD0E2